MRIFLFTLLLVLAISFRETQKLFQREAREKNSQPLPQEKHYFKQIVDHYNYQKTQYWDQRYFVHGNEFNPKIGPVFLYICGEYVCPGVPESRQWVVKMAERLQGLIIVVEHRFYGQSLPFGNKSFQISNMRYLNSEQALSDLAYFIQQIKVRGLHRVEEKNPWITIGGSYPGALSAWFRYKYPHLTVGSIASSAVIQAIQNFPQFDEQIYSSSHLSGDWCSEAINKTANQVSQILDSESGLSFKTQFPRGEHLTDDQFMFFWVDSVVGVIQYGQRTKLCNDIKGKSDKDLLTYFVNNALENDVYQYGSYFLSNETFALQNGQGSRSWYYQSCSQFGYWQTMSKVHPMRPERLNLDFYKKLCNDSFGDQLWPKVERKNIQLGALLMEATNLLMVNGVEDPWRWASLQQSKGDIISRVANCTNCAHCVDLYTPSSSDSSQLKKIRDEQYLTVQQWVLKHWRQNYAYVFGASKQQKPSYKMKILKNYAAVKKLMKLE